MAERMKGPERCREVVSPRFLDVALSELGQSQSDLELWAYSANGAIFGWSWAEVGPKSVDIGHSWPVNREKMPPEWAKLLSKSGRTRSTKPTQKRLGRFGHSGGGPKSIEVGQIWREPHKSGRLGQSLAGFDPSSNNVGPIEPDFCPRWSSLENIGC